MGGSVYVYTCAELCVWEFVPTCSKDALCEILLLCAYFQGLACLEGSG